MPLQTRNFILDVLCDLAIGDYIARPFDCAFELLAAPPSRKRLIMVGFNGSLADAIHTNAGSICAGYDQLNVPMLLMVLRVDGAENPGPALD
ncbi:hypothetical protein G3O07_11715 [Pseudomonas laurentiana]|uniref:Uncharacterized protein n=1 Tax=Pseudomonas laurentiana TaxID=2364649 RepID=A0A6I5RR90_9PSED|nr:hypothetical protein [Pseudomonas laurentiana]